MLKLGIGALMIGLAGYVVVYVGKQAKILVGTVIEFAGLKINKFTLQNVFLTLFFKVLNKSDIGFTIQNQSWKIYLKGELIKELVNPNQIKVLPHSDTRLPIYLNFTIAEALTLGLTQFNLIQNEDDRAKTKIKIVGVITVGTSVIEFKKIPIEIEDTLQNFIKTE